MTVSSFLQVTKESTCSIGLCTWDMIQAWRLCLGTVDFTSPIVLGYYHQVLRPTPAEARACSRYDIIGWGRGTILPRATLNTSIRRGWNWLPGIDTYSREWFVFSACNTSMNTHHGLIHLHGAPHKLLQTQQLTSQQKAKTKPKNITMDLCQWNLLVLP